MLAAQTDSGADSTNNACNIPYDHAFSIIAVFNIIATNGTLIPSLMVRNPWGTCGSSCYN